MILYQEKEKMAMENYNPYENMLNRDYFCNFIRKGANMKKKDKLKVHPIIGIRPIIDARQGMLRVRESLEEQTMSMAEAAKKLFQENICYTDCTPVEVVIADGTIGRVAEAAAMDGFLSEYGLSGSHFEFFV